MQRLSPQQILVISFAAVILFGSLLLTLPIATQSGNVNYLTSLFTATSAVCVTGLVVVDTATHWSLFGQIVILLLIQVGGLGLMSFATFFAILLGRKIQLRQRLVLKAAANKSSLEGIVDVFRHVLLFVLFFESLGALILAIHWSPLLGFKKALWFGLFHSISAFNNAGFDLFGHFNSLTAFTSDWIVNLVITTLIIVGGIGFLVIYEIYKHKKNTPLSLHTRVALITTALLIIVGTVILFCSEYYHAFRGLTLQGKFLASYFQAVSPRTAGFNTVDLNNLYLSSKFLIILLMFIGGSPGSTAGGIKTTTFALLWIAIFSQIRGKKDSEVFERRIPVKDVVQALTVTMMAGFVLIAAAFTLALFHESAGLMAILFEVTSALGTVGLTLGLTTQLAPIPQVLIILTMFLGRVGPLTLGFALAYREEPAEVRYPTGTIMIG